MHVLVKAAPVLALMLATAALAACEKQVQPPRARGKCFHMVGAEGQPPKFNDLPGHYKSLEYCAAALERVRLNGARQRITGAYQGQFIFAQARGIFVGQTLTGPRYLALLRTGDGKLAPPGAIR